MGKKIGFVGLGTIGLPMAINLNKAGFEVIGYDAFAGSRTKAKAAGIKTSASLKEVAEQADDAIVSMLRDYAQNVEVILGDGGLLSVKPKGLTIIVMSTLGPEGRARQGPGERNHDAIQRPFVHTVVRLLGPEAESQVRGTCPSLRRRSLPKRQRHVLRRRCFELRPTCRKC